jgi:type IV secretory pathway ATPase VirB11/archaellum biosynthesis ATPase
MIVKEVAFGNLNEAFIENRFENKTNIIFSNDNNRGKTLLMQSLIYSIGYESIFPNSFSNK